MKPFKMPEIGLGWPVAWKHSPGDSEVVAGFVTRIGDRGISVMLFPSEARVGTLKEGVRHVSDPDLATFVEYDQGVWDHTSLTKMVLQIKAERELAQAKAAQTTK